MHHSCENKMLVGEYKPSDLFHLAGADLSVRRFHNEPWKLPSESADWIARMK